MTRALAVLGTVLIWFPIAATVLLGLVRTIQIGRLQVDYLMPAELAPAVLLGAVLLLWAAIRAHARRGLVGWGLGLAVGLLVGSQLIATATGLASGAIEPTGWPFVFVLGMLAAYIAAVIELGVAGVLLSRDAFAHPAEGEPGGPAAASPA